jgi:AcrR family transcriptional regulator
MNGYERRKHKKMDSILTAALSLFQQYSISKVNMVEIARLAGVSPATLFNYFGNKTGLVVHLLSHLMDQQLEQHIAILRSTLPFPEKTRMILLGEVEILKKISFAYDATVGAEQTEIMALLTKYELEKIMPFFHEYFHLGQKEGFIPTHLPVETIAYYMDMYKNQLERIMRTVPESEQDAVLETYLHFFFYGLSVKEKE